MADKMVKGTLIKQGRGVTLERQVTEETRVQGADRPTTYVQEKTVDVMISASCKTLDGFDIVNPQGEFLGKFEDIMLNMRSGKVDYAVISLSGGVLGMNSRFIAVPWEALSMVEVPAYENERARRKMILNIPKSRLKDAPTFDKDSWPIEPDREWLNKNLYSVFGYEPSWKKENNNTSPQP